MLERGRKDVKASLVNCSLKQMMSYCFEGLKCNSRLKVIHKFRFIYGLWMDWWCAT